MSRGIRVFPARGEVEIQFNSRRSAECVYHSLLPEAELPGAEVKIKLEGKTLWILVRGRDKGMLRATLNSTLSWVKMATEVISVE
ncbi:MAG: KEOPS complex subunit Pcc1 [Candidatus Hadarchaeales archaeon]